MKVILWRLWDWSKDKEPAVMSGFAVSFFSSLVGLLSLWGIPMSDAKQTAVQATIVAVVGAATTLSVFIRQLVTPTPKAVSAITDALEQAPPSVNATSKDIASRAAHILAEAKPTPTPTG